MSGAMIHKQWENEATGYPCLLMRTTKGNYYGYVGVPDSCLFYGLPVGRTELPFGTLDLFRQEFSKVSYSEALPPIPTEIEGKDLVALKELVASRWWLGVGYSANADEIETDLERLAHDLGFHDTERQPSDRLWVLFEYVHWDRVEHPVRFEEEREPFNYSRWELERMEPPKEDE